MHVLAVLDVSTWVNNRHNAEVSLFGTQVLKFLMEKASTNALHGQVTIGTLILQVFSLLSFSFPFFFPNDVSFMDSPLYV